MRHSGVHRTLRIGRDSSDFVAYPESILFEPMSLREENWVERDTKNALRAEASKSSHAVVNQPTPTPLEEPVDTPNNLVVRRLTPLECELLMGWDPNWTAEGVEEDGKVVKMADTHRYRMCGNGVVANVGEWIAVRYVAAKTAAEEIDR